ncbi:MAG: glycosyltransferase family 4 protein [Dysgonamonadaceae bacterium]|jgi:glycosyltransferase involved in cell wall biosynthesis|nr:glycosyltransferase family 4 protein [Dysgonamonadaceae bacterium]
MKITHVLWSLQYGGAETMLVDIVNRQCLLHDIEIVLVNNVIDDDLLKMIDSRIKITRINRPAQSKNPYYLLNLNLLILFSKADIIHFHQDNLIRYLPVRLLKHNLLLTVHCVRLDAEDVRKYNYIFAITDAVQEHVLQTTGRKATLVLNGIDVRKFNIQKREPDGIFKIVQIGRITHLHKGQHITLQALHNLITQYNYTNVHLDIIGEGDSETYLKKLTQELHIESFVTFLGNRTKEFVQTHLSSYDLLVQPSLWEGFGLTVIEAMSAMTPTLISNVDGMQTASGNGTFAYTFQSGNADDFAGKLNEIIYLPKAEKEALAEKAYDFVLKNFDISLTVDNYLNYYETFLFQSNKKKSHEDSPT